MAVKKKSKNLNKNKAESPRFILKKIKSILAIDKGINVFPVSSNITVS